VVHHDFVNCIVLSLVTAHEGLLSFALIRMLRYGIERGSKRRIIVRVVTDYKNHAQSAYETGNVTGRL
jgi:hypothetical protein